MTGLPGARERDDLHLLSFVEGGYCGQGKLVRS